MLSTVNNEQPNKGSVSASIIDSWSEGACKPPSVALRSVHNVINRYLKVTQPDVVDGLSSGNVDIIVYLDHHENEDVFPQDIEQRFGITRSTSCRVLGLMERKGLIAREPVPHDARMKRIVLTEQSRTIATMLRENAESMESVLLQGLDDDDIRRFMHVLDVMQTNLLASGKIGDSRQYPSLDLCDPPDAAGREPGEGANDSEDRKEEQ
ncbi:MarR family winged helix-turn-helix transcriptional regulator [Bifidobacterium pongonis]|uniref:MarR family winged helix-turn-helix transcriptional regulator n=1 Tax=Bifidobacterium pongonis TaxID=2834432 RepID=UPI001F39C782|nr:MarR family winged helix-turn-helix transcriptional regulator [Bifidobacterium pongonis]